MSAARDQLLKENAAKFLALPDAERAITFELTVPPHLRADLGEDRWRAYRALKAQDMARLFPGEWVVSWTDDTHARLYPAHLRENTAAARAILAGA